MRKSALDRKVISLYDQKFHYSDVFRNCDTIEKMIEALTRLKQKEREYTVLHNANIEYVLDSYNLRMIATRPETDNEYNTRLEKNAQAAARKAKTAADKKAAKEKEDLELYKKLHKKYAKVLNA